MRCGRFRWSRSTSVGPIMGSLLHAKTPTWVSSPREHARCNHRWGWPLRIDGSQGRPPPSANLGLYDSTALRYITKARQNGLFAVISVGVGLGSLTFKMIFGMRSAVCRPSRFPQTSRNFHPPQSASKSKNSHSLVSKGFLGRSYRLSEKIPGCKMIAD